jgi:hypothetical protein
MNSLPGDMHFVGIESWRFSFLGICPHKLHNSLNFIPHLWDFDGIVTLGGNGFHGICPLRSVLLYNFIPHLMVFDGIVSLGNFQFHGLLALGVMDFMEFVPTVQSFHPILSLRTGILCKSLSGDYYFHQLN